MDTSPPYDPGKRIKKLLEELLEEFNRLSPEQYRELQAPAFDHTNPVPDVNDCITWLGPIECIDVLFKLAVSQEEILDDIDQAWFRDLFLAKEAPVIRARISHLKISEWIYLLKAFRERSPRLIAKDAHLKNQLWLLFSDHQGKKLDDQSLRRLVSRCRVKSEKRQEVLEDIITAVHKEYDRVQKRSVNGKKE